MLKTNQQQYIIKTSNQVCYALPYSGEGRAPWPNGYFRVLIGNAIQFVKESNLKKLVQSNPLKGGNHEVQTA